MLNGNEKNKSNISKVKPDALKDNLKDINDENMIKKEKEKIEERATSFIINENSYVKWENIVGYEELKQALKEQIISPIKYPKQFQEKQKPVKSILIYGPPGTGKTLLSKAIAAELEGNFFYILACNIITKWNQSDSDKIIKDLFDLARKKKPSVIFIDEIDCILNEKSYYDNDTIRKIKNEFLLQMKNVEDNDEDIMVLGSTNIPWTLDGNIINIFQKKMYISLPDCDARKKIIELNLKDITHTLTDQQIEYLAQNTKDFSGSDIYNLVQDVFYEPLRKYMNYEYFKKVKGTDGNQWNYIPCEQNDTGAIKMKMTEITDLKLILLPKVDINDFKKALERARPSMDEQDLTNFEKFTLDFGKDYK